MTLSLNRSFVPGAKDWGMDGWREIHRSTVRIAVDPK